MFGIDNIAFSTSKYKSGWRVTLLWYDTIISQDCPTESQKGVALIGFNSCLNKYNFYYRRWHDYDYTKGVERRPGDGETGAGNKQPGDMPNDNPKKKKREIPFAQPIKKKPNSVLKKVIKKKPVPKKTPVEKRTIDDDNIKKQLKASLQIRQVVDMKKKFEWLSEVRK